MRSNIAALKHSSCLKPQKACQTRAVELSPVSKKKITETTKEGGRWPVEGVLCLQNCPLWEKG